MQKENLWQEKLSFENGLITIERNKGREKKNQFTKDNQKTRCQGQQGFPTAAGCAGLAGTALWMGEIRKIKQYGPIAKVEFYQRYLLNKIIYDNNKQDEEFKLVYKEQHMYEQQNLDELMNLSSENIQSLIQIRQKKSIKYFKQANFILNIKLIIKVKQFQFTFSNFQQSIIHLTYLTLFYD